MEIKDLKTVEDYLNYVTDKVAPKFTEAFDHYFIQAQKELEDYNNGKIETIELRALPDENSKTFICPTGEYPGVCLEVMYNGDNTLRGYTFFLYKRHTPINPEDGLPAIIYKDETVCFFSPKELLTLKEIDDTPLTTEIISEPRNNDGPFSISASGEKCYNIAGTSETCTQEEYENSRLLANLQLLDKLTSKQK